MSVEERSLSYAVLVTGPVYGTQQAFMAYQFSQSVFDAGHRVGDIFFYREGVSNANSCVLPASDEVNLVALWQALATEHHIHLHICVAAALRRGVVDQHYVTQHQLTGVTLAKGFQLTGLGGLAEMVLIHDRVMQF